MKRNIPEQPIKTDWSVLARSLLRPVACVLGLALAALLFGAAIKTRSPKVPAEPPRVLMIGDSLSVGKFGEVFGDYLVDNYGARNVALFASCGSSPEHWLRAEPTFYTKCGFRSRTPNGAVYLDFDHGRRPRQVPTPKLERLIQEYRPNILFVQLGTNWMDRLVSGNPAKEIEMRDYLDRFVAAARSQPGTAQRIIWIMPPDSAHFSRRVHGTVESIIRAGSRKYRQLDVIPSRDMTHYVPGRTGGDGVHYNAEASAEWANRVITRLRSQSAMAGIYGAR
jgi:lysophospholipase L1-like esterase